MLGFTHSMPAPAVLGSGLPVPRRRMFAADILSFAHSDAAGAPPSWLRLASYAGSGARAAPRGVHAALVQADRP